jgi:hypothetical protein
VATFVKYCPNCGSVIKENARFCGQCGAPINSLDGGYNEEPVILNHSSPNPAPILQQTPPPSSFTPPPSPLYSPTNSNEASKSKRTVGLVALFVGLFLLACCCFLAIAGLYTFRSSSNIPTKIQAQFENMLPSEIPSITKPSPMNATEAPFPPVSKGTLLPPVSTQHEIPITNIGEPKNKIKFKNAAFGLDPEIALDAKGETVPAEKSSGDTPTLPGSVYPEHILFNLENYKDENHFLEPQIIIYPIDAYKTIDPRAARFSSFIEDKE